MAALLQLVAARGGAFPRPGNKGSRDQCVKTNLYCNDWAGSASEWDS